MVKEEGIIKTNLRMGDSGMAENEDRTNRRGSKTKREDARMIWEESIARVVPYESVIDCLKKIDPGRGQIVTIAVGKAGWTMAKAAADYCGERLHAGVVVTKYEHSEGPIPGFQIIEAGHPYMDENAILGAEAAIGAVRGLTEDDTVLFLLSGGGSALFELPAISFSELQDINRQLIACGAGIQEINTIRKRLSRVKGGRFAKLCEPARVVTIILSDIIDNRMDMVASGPTCPDSSTAEEALQIVKKYGLKLSEAALAHLSEPMPKTLGNVEYHFCGNVQLLCEVAAQVCERLGYTPRIITETMHCEAREAGRMIAKMAREYAAQPERRALLFGGETVVVLTGSGKGGRNQEIALAAAEGIAGLERVAVFSFGSDGTDGPTDAAGGYADGKSYGEMKALGIDPDAVLANNDSYNALKQVDDLIITGRTGTNVCDLSVALIG